MRILLILLFLAASSARSHGQVLISILFGEKLNSPNIEFGLDGGLSFANLEGLEPSKAKRSLNLGFYFDFKMRNPAWRFRTGVMVKSTMGATNVAPYNLDDPALNLAFQDGTVITKLGYFNVPLMLKYKAINNFFVEVGPMLGLMNRNATDRFIATVETKDDLTYVTNIKHKYHPMDIGMLGGVGYRLMGGNGMNLGVRYYYGFIDVTIDDSSPDQHNTALYLFVGIPIGVGKKAE